MNDISPPDEVRREEVRAAYQRLGRIFVWSGWVVAFIALTLGAHLINGLHERVVGLEKENRQLVQKNQMASLSTDGSQRQK